MKKNAMLKIAAILLVAVLLTTCAISATFAKYVTKSETVESVTAHVARWGVNVSATANGDLFKQAYSNTTHGEVVATTQDTVVAPGTTSEGSIALALSFDGTPEVVYTIDTDVKLVAENWPTDYFPLIFVITNGTERIECKGATPAAVEASINAELEGIFNVDGKGITEAKTVTITWEWPYFVDEDTDVKDTSLGDQDTLPTIQVTASMSAVQTGLDFAK